VSEPKCENCRFYENLTNFCLRYPPRPVVSVYDTSRYGLQSNVESAFPIIPHSAWCGEHEPRGDGSDE
jgi:hypothetical protein